MRIKLISVVWLTGIITGCGGESGDSNGLTALNQQNAVVSANSLEMLEHPIAMSNFIISALHQLKVSNGEVTGGCNATLDNTGSYFAKLNDRVLSIELNDCDITGKEKISGSATARFSHLTKSGQYLEFDGELETGQLQYDDYGEQYTVSYSAHLVQAIESPHKVKLNMTLSGNESILINGVPFFFENSNATKVLDYNLGTYAVTAKADISSPATFNGKLALRTPAPLSGAIEQYPTAGHYEIRGANNDAVSVSPGSTGDWAKITVNASGVVENTEVSWSHMMSGAIVAFPSRRGISTGDFYRPVSADEHWYFPEQSPPTLKTAEHPLRPIHTLFVVPAPEPEDLLDAELDNTYQSTHLSDEMYKISANGPWVTVRFLDDLPVDSTFSMSLKDHEGNYFANYSFDTKETFEVSVTKDQVIQSHELFLLEPIKVTDDSQSFSIDWSQSFGDKTITINQINTKQASIDPSEMTPGNVYRFKAQITDPFGRKSSSEVALIVEDPVKGSSYFSIETNSQYRPDPNVSIFNVIKSSGAINNKNTEIRSIDDSGFEHSYALIADGLNNGYVDKSMGNSFYLETSGKTWTYNCSHSTLQLDVLQDEWVDEGIDSESGRLSGYQKLALDFTITCDGGTLAGKIRSNSLIK